MPILGLSNRGEAFPQIGDIRKGAPKAKNAEGREIMGKELPYFRVEFAEGEDVAAAKFLSVYGTQPAAINIVFTFNDLVKHWDPWYEAYLAGSQIGKSDGEIVHYLRDPGTYELLVQDGIDLRTGQPMPHPKDHVAGYTAKKEAVKFKATGRLRVIIPELQRAAYLVVHTTSVYDVGNISDQLRAFQTINNGQIAGIPFILRRVPKMIPTPGENGRKVRRRKWMISVEADPNWVQKMLAQINTLALPDFDASAIQPQLPPAEFTEGEIEDEFDEDEIEEGQGTPSTNPDPITELAWKEWVALTQRAAKVKIACPNVNRDTTTMPDLREAYKALFKKVEAAEAK